METTFEELSSLTLSASTLLGLLLSSILLTIPLSTVFADSLWTYILKLHRRLGIRRYMDLVSLPLLAAIGGALIGASISPLIDAVGAEDRATGWRAIVVALSGMAVIIVGPIAVELTSAQPNKYNLGLRVHHLLASPSLSLAEEVRSEVRDELHELRRQYRKFDIRFLRLWWASWTTSLGLFIAFHSLDEIDKDLSFQIVAAFLVSSLAISPFLKEKLQLWQFRRSCRSRFQILAEVSTVRAEQRKILRRAKVARLRNRNARPQRTSHCAGRRVRRI